MGLFSKKIVDFAAPFGGKILRIEDVPDKVFSEKMMGEGFAVEFDDNYVYAPFDAEVITVFRTGHAIGLKSKDYEVLIHVGLETVHLNGECFEILVQTNDRVKKGDKLIKVDTQYIRNRNLSLISPVVFTDDSRVKVKNPGQFIKALDTNIIDIK